MGTQPGVRMAGYTVPVVAGTPSVPVVAGTPFVLVVVGTPFVPVVAGTPFVPVVADTPFVLVVAVVGRYLAPAAWPPRLGGKSPNMVPFHLPLAAWARYKH